MNADAGPRLIARAPARGLRLGRGAAVALTTVILCVAAAGEARAQGKLVDLHGALLMGGMTGGGSNSSADMYHQIAGGGFAAELGVRLLLVDFSLRFQQMLDSGGAGGTVLSALLGPSIEIPVIGGGRDDQGRARPAQVVIRPSLAAGLVLGTREPIDLPLNNDQLAGKGFLTMGRFAVERMFGRFLGVGAELEAGYHYLLGHTGVINSNDHSSGWQLGAFATVAFHLGV